jgi:cyclin-dependent kinase regulatory subunit CKS1
MSDLDYNRRNKHPRPLSDSEKARLEEFIDSIHYSARQVELSADWFEKSIFAWLSIADRLISSRYSDDDYEYRHVQLPKNMLKAIPKDYHDPTKGTLKLLWEEEWRALGITQVRRIYFRPVGMYGLTDMPTESWMGTL